MSYKRVKKVRCIKNINSKEEKVPLTIGKEYDQIISNTGINSNRFGVFDDNSCFTVFSKDFFEITETSINDGNGFKIECKDCGTILTIEEFIKGKCPNSECGQLINLECNNKS